MLHMFCKHRGKRCRHTVDGQRHTPLPSIFSVSWNLNYSPASIVSAVTSALGTLMSASTVSPAITLYAISMLCLPISTGSWEADANILPSFDCGHSVFGTVYAHDLDLAELTRAVNGRRAADCRRIVECEHTVGPDTPAAYFPITGIAVSTPGWISCSSTISMSGYLESASLKPFALSAQTWATLSSQHHDLSLAFKRFPSASPISWPAMKLSVATVLATRLVSSTGEL